jgi:hypothetical protein
LPVLQVVSTSIFSWLNDDIAQFLPSALNILKSNFFLASNVGQSMICGVLRQRHYVLCFLWKQPVVANHKELSSRLG